MSWRTTVRLVEQSVRGLLRAGRSDLPIRQETRSMGPDQKGDTELRRLLYLAAQANLRSKDSPFKAHYERERAKGLSSTVALYAVARKLARPCWSPVVYSSTYDPKRIYQKNSH